MDLFMPLLFGNAYGKPPPSCLPLRPFEEELLRLMVEDPEQRRKSIHCHPILQRVARERGEDMARRNYFNHTNPDGDGPNVLVTRAGYRLPGWYPTDQDANSIESISGGRPTAEDVWNALRVSPGHRSHVLGMEDFFAKQTNVGIGYTLVEHSHHWHYWVILSAHPEVRPT